MANLLRRLFFLIIIIELEQIQALRQGTVVSVLVCLSSQSTYVYEMLKCLGLCFMDGIKFYN